MYDKLSPSVVKVIKQTPELRKIYEIGFFKGMHEAAKASSKGIEERMKQCIQEVEESTESHAPFVGK